MFNLFKKPKTEKPTKGKVEGVVVEQFGLLDDEHQSTCFNLPSQRDVNWAYQVALVNHDGDWEGQVRSLAGEIYAGRRYARTE